MKTDLYSELQNINMDDKEALTAAALQIKELGRDEDGVFDLTGLCVDPWEAGAVVYPVYVKYETDINKKTGYPDIMAQMRSLKSRAYKALDLQQAVKYLTVLIGAIETISPEIYENYRELVEDFRQTAHRVIDELKLDSDKPLAGLTDKTVSGQLALVLERAFEQRVLLREKYQELARALQG